MSVDLFHCFEYCQEMMVFNILVSTQDFGTYENLCKMATLKKTPRIFFPGPIIA